jgi:formamidopyrimidine-DNA glycosylase
MVEGHSVHRLASAFRSKLVGRKFAASSPNGRFVEGAAAIDGRVLTRMEAVGKNLFAFFEHRAGDDDDDDDDDDDGRVRSTSGGGGGFEDDDTAKGEDDVVDADDVVVVHVHFGMSGVWAIHDTAAEPEPVTRPTTRLRLEEIKEDDVGDVGDRCRSQNNIKDNSLFVTHLSAMTVSHGPASLYISKKASLGQDPLRFDANPNMLYGRVSTSKKSIGSLIMDQSYFAGPGNIYRAEILFLAGVYPTAPGSSLDRSTFDRVWNACVVLLRRGYDTGSILTVDAAIDPDVCARGERRYIYNRSTCARCGSGVRSWDMSGRTCYACEGGTCQPKIDSRAAKDHAEGGRASAENWDDIATTASRFATTTEAKSECATEEGKTGGIVGGNSSPRAQRHTPFISHCAPINYKKRLEEGGATNLTIKEIRSAMLELIGRTSDADDDAAADNDLLPHKSAKKSVHVEALELLLERRSRRRRQQYIAATPPPPLRVKNDRSKEPPIIVGATTLLPPPLVSAEDAAREKLIGGENRAVEHIAELSRGQAVRALASVTPSPAKKSGLRDDYERNNICDADDDDNFNDVRKKSSRCRRRLVK